MIPRATLRLQFHRDFTFADAARRAEWIAALGVSHVYASPIAMARPGSMHGYDVIDPMRVNPELGGEEGLLSLAATLRTVGVGLILDIVPNHMAADTRNEWWRDVLRQGRASRHAEWFDVDWDTAEEGPTKILLPVLGRPLAEVIDAGELSVAHDKEGVRNCAISRIRSRFATTAPRSAAASPICWRGSITGWPRGVPRVTGLTGVVSSTSTSWSACAWSGRKPSRRSMPCRCSSIPKAS